MRTVFTVLAVAVCLSMPALAADAAPVVAQTAGEAFMSTAAMPIAGALVTIVIALGAFLAAWLRNKSAEASTTTASRVAETLSAKLLEILVAAVRTTYATMSPALAAAAADGKLTAEESAKLRSDTLTAAMSALGDAFKNQLLSGLGLSDAGLTVFAGGMLEQAINTVKVQRSQEVAVRSQAAAVTAQHELATATAEKSTGDLLNAAAGAPAKATS